MTEHPVETIANACGGEIKEMGILPDGSGFATVSFPLRSNHWIYQKDDTPAGFQTNVPPMPFRMGNRQIFAFCIEESRTITKREFENAIRAAGKYAIRCATLNGAEDDFDPDALLQNLVVGMLGYWTDDGLTGCSEDASWCDPQKPFDFHEK